ncbi:DNA-binding transcriptional regulator, IclR family [Bosea sp. 62]|uniref:IclR family transcriptional regulator n=1 Tax=unclassified Bosea (in: a-proteobacteria) TaxID=2653178 RepID=UPI0012523489|nr:MULTISPECIES: IclR family transcriptional regulator [unclassified Bosea (in: a-proteobacteria)]CAD5295582.1 DNA-binding transcriptional regulator, IclR family [Bosea sp. 21B]CAD5295944.1 DNA-binding transcriptional regulator, IclR family [Bosea sp. 46]CAD5298021.1 DNA-binding transcriptional regulator, IclR family [Bosea sp. 7B]VVT61021.1 DNA-binding transcriptional regulator, IclR family [Bosea sp. EC-HK365B]VXB32273.1 DNA-binding transcriptional regulator, IclR family [Bosea sp. 127]
MTIAAVERAFKLLEALADEADGADLTVLAERLDLPVSATHRLLATLGERGFVTQDPQSGAYGLTLKLSQLAFRNLDLRGLPDAGQIVLDGLARATREYCRLAVIEGESLTWIARAQGATAGLRYEPPMGMGPVLHATATGKAWLASLPEQEALRIVCARGFDGEGRTGPNALGDVDALRQHLGETRSRGYALAVEEGEIGTVAMATTFRAGPDPSAPVAGTLSVAGPLPRMHEVRRSEIATALATAATEMATIWPLRRRQIGALPAVSTEAALRVLPTETSA